MYSEEDSYDAGKTSFEDETWTLADRLFNAGLDLEAHNALVSELLQQCHELDTRVLTIYEAIRVRFACSSLCARLRERVKHIPDAKKSVPSRNLALVASLWSPNVIRYYQWDRASQKVLRLLRRIAERFPDFDDLVPAANAVLIERHERAIVNNQVRSVQEDSRRCPLEQQDLKRILEGAAPLDSTREKLWTSSTSSTFCVAGKTLSEWRGEKAHLYLLQHDKYGLVTKRDPRDHVHLKSGGQPRSGGESPNTASGDEDEPEVADSDACGDEEGQDPDDKEKGEFDATDSDSAREISEKAADHRRRNESGGEVNPDGEDESNATARAYQHRFCDSQPICPSISALTDQAQSDIAISDALYEDDGNLSMAQLRHNKYRDKINVYMRELQHQRTQVLHKLRKQWLQPTTRWAKLYVRGECGVGMASCHEQAEVLCFSADDFCSYAGSGHPIDRPVLIQENFTDTGMHTLEGYATLLRDGYSTEHISVRNSTTLSVEEKPVSWFCDRITSPSTIGAGTNALNLHAIAGAHRPRFTYLPRYQLLRSLVARSRKLGKSTTTEANDVTSCESFDILGLPGAFSGAHVDALTGTWLRNLTGIKLWMIIPERQMAGDWSTFAREGPLYEPHGKERLILLDKDDVLFMPPGLKVVHAVHTMETSLMEGGMLWDYLNITPTLQAIHWIATHQISTNEALPWELPAVVKTLEDAVSTNAARFQQQELEPYAKCQRAIRQLQALGCACFDCDVDQCSCHANSRRCTQWCNGHKAVPSTQNHCMHEYASLSSAEHSASYEDPRPRKRPRRS